jgi:hypothetical protein
VLGAISVAIQSWAERDDADLAALLDEAFAALRAGCVSR